MTRAIAIKISVVLLSSALLGTLLIVLPNARQEKLTSLDSYYHVMLVRGIASHNVSYLSGAVFWNSIQTGYPPLFPYLNASIANLLKIEDFIQYAKIMSAVTVMLLIIGFGALAWQVIPKVTYVSLIYILLSATYFPILRLGQFLPENAAILGLIALLWVLLHQVWPLRRRLLISITLLSLITLTNILTATYAFALIMLWIPVLLYQRKYREAASHALLTATGIAISLLIPNLDSFWVKYVMSVSGLATIASLLVLGLQWLAEKIHVKPLILLGGSIVVLSLSFVVCGVSQGWGIYRAFFNEQYWLAQDLPLRFLQIWRQTFLRNGSPVSINLMLLLVSLAGIILRLIKRQLLVGPFRLLFTIFVLSLGTLFFGPYAGINPDINTPRAILYLSIAAVFFAGYLINQVFQRGYWIAGISLIMSIVLTTMVGSVRLTQRDESVNVPSTIIDQVELFHRTYPDKKILTDPNTFAEIVARAQSDLSALINTKKVTAVTFRNDNASSVMRDAKIGMVIQTPRFDWTPPDTLIMSSSSVYDGYVIFSFGS